MSGTGHLFILQLDRQRYALHLEQVSRVLRMVEITPLPAASAGLLGLVNVQGEVLPVLDLRHCFQQRGRRVEPQDVLVIAEGSGSKIALVADAVEGVSEFSLASLSADQELLRQSDYLEAVLKLPDGLVLVCDLAKLLTLCPVALPQGESLERLADEGETPGPEVPVEAESEASRVLRERARRLALEPTLQEPERRLEIVEFLLSGERYAFESRYIREVYPLRELTPLPGTPPFVLGIVNLRGKILSVLDIRRLFDLADRGLSDLNKVIILEETGMEFGVLADAIVGVRTIAAQELQPPLATSTGIRGEYLKGVTAERLVVLDASRLLHDRGIIVHEQA
jgi:purine-binding chemotaxis protein CheW